MNKNHLVNPVILSKEMKEGVGFITTGGSYYG